MAPVKKKRGSYIRYDKHQLERALTDVAEGKLSIREAAEKYGLPKSTLHDKFKGKQFYTKSGRPTVLSEKDEKDIVSGLLISAEWGYPLTQRDVKVVVKGFLDKKGVIERRFKNNSPGPKWMKSFLQRHRRTLSTRLSENIKRNRAAVTKEVVDKYFDNLQATLKDIPETHILNYDETNMSDDPGQEKVLVRRGSKHADRVLDSSKSSVSVMFTVSASGTRLPVYIVYKAQHLHDSWIQHGPPGALYNRTSSGWFDSYIFDNWFERVALPYFKKLPPGKKVLIGDNLASHISINIISRCVENDIQFVLLPANATHLCQPLDVAYFRPLKMAWKRILLDWKKRHRGSITKEYFPQLLHKVLVSLKDTEKSNIIAGFRACGIVPLDRQQVLKRLPRQNTREDNGPAWCEAFTGHLQQLRSNDTQPKRQRRKKLSVPPGKAVTASDFFQENQTNELEVEEENQSENEDEVSEVEVEQSEVKVPETQNEHAGDPFRHGTDSNSNDSLVAVEQPEIGRYIVCTFVYNQNTKKETVKNYIAKIVDLMENGEETHYQISCLRKKGDFFVYPDIEDVNVVKKQQIKTILGTPKERRGRFIFPETIPVQLS